MTCSHRLGSALKDVSAANRSSGREWQGVPSAEHAVGHGSGTHFSRKHKDDTLINNRQAGRRRGRNNPRQQSGGGNRGNGDSGNRIDSRARGNAVQLLEKYRNLARDAQLSGDRVNVEYYLQFADHYFRVLADNRARQEEQQQRFRRNDDNDQDGYDGPDEGDDLGGDDMDDGFGPIVTQQPQRQERQERAERQERPERQERQERRPRSEEPREPRRTERQEREPRRREERPRRDTQIANDDNDIDLGNSLNLAALPPAIGRPDIAEVADFESDSGAGERAVQEAPAAAVEDAAPAKPRRGRPRRVAAPVAETPDAEQAAE